MNIAVCQRGDEMDNTSQGHSDFIETICAQTWKDLYRFIYYKVQNREEAQDITQETYVRAIAYLEKNRDQIINYRGYLRTIAINIIRDQWRRKRRWGNSINIEEVNPEKLQEEDFTETVNNQSVIAGALKQLTPEQQEVITLRIIKGYSAAETARIMGRKEGTIRVMQYRALQILSDLLEVTV
jgi:RNA polymerase sigma-70 factor (ECF subfamily)